MSKQCSNCRQNKKEAEFYKRPKRSDLQPACRDCYRTKFIARKYSLTKEQYDQMLTDQGNKCATCNKESKTKLHIDHSHETGQTRKLLCSQCNTALGLVKENIETLSTMIMYVNYFSELAAINTNTAKQLERVG